MSDAIEDVSWRCCGQWWGLARTHCLVCGTPSHASGPTERERAEWLRRADTAVPAEAWELFKRGADQPTEPQS